MAAPVAIYEWYNDKNGDHEYAQRRTPYGPGWRAGDVGIAFKAFSQQQPGTVAVYEYFNDGLPDHEYTTRDHPYDQNWRRGDADVAFYAYPSKEEGTVPIYEYYSDRYCRHEYSQRGHPYDGNWRKGDQGVAFYAYPSDFQGERVAYVKMLLTPLMSKDTTAGEMTFDQEVTEGYTHSVELNAKFNMNVATEIGAGLGAFTAKAKMEYGLEIGASYNFSYSSTTTTKKIMKMPAGSRGFIYQAAVQARTNKGAAMEWKGGLLMTDKQVNLVQEKYL